MANTCFNWVEVFGEAKALQKIKSDFENGSFYGHHFSELDMWTSTKGHLIFDGTSRWSPPHEWVAEQSKKYGVLIELEYEEAGSDICGKFGYKCGEHVFSLDFTYLEGKYNLMDWNEFVNSVVMSELDDPDPFDEFMERFSFVSDEHRIELEELFFEYANEN